MNRRDILRAAAWLSGTAIATPLATVVLTGCSPSGESTQNAGKSAADGHFFSSTSFDQATRLADALLPATDSPSASDVKVPEALDTLLGQVLDVDYVSSFRRLWGDLEAFLTQQDFAQLNPSQREALLSDLEAQAEPTQANARDALVMFKQQVVILYLTSETIAENYLNYLPIPGSYQPCISVDEVDNTAWAI